MLDTPYPNVISGPPRPSRILTPRDLERHHGRERHSIPGAGALMLRLGAGDKLTVVNDEGGQIAELVAATTTGRVDAALLGQVSNSGAEGLKAMLAMGDAAGAGLARLRHGLAARGIDLGQAGALRLFAPDTGAGARADLTALDDGWLVIAAPGLPMAPAAQDTATPITLLVQRAKPREVGKFDLPDPLADPVLDLRVKSATAESYFVKAGDYIQIIDVEGRQCTDFQCFDARKLDRGIQHAWT
jgi:aminomethyltransferase